MKRIRYRIYHLFLDLFGLFGIGLTISFLIKGHTIRDVYPERHALWANFATEIVAIWLGVRIVEFVIRKYENEDRGRTRIVRSSRFLMGFIRNFIEYPRRADLEKFNNELKWIRKMFNQYRSYFQHDEIIEIENFYAGLVAIQPELNNLLNLLIGLNTGINSKQELEKKREELWVQAKDLEVKRLEAEENILAETDEEWL